MRAAPESRDRGSGLTNRDTERVILDHFVAGVRAGEGQALVVRGEPGVGKTALLDYLAGRAEGCRVIRATGVQSEMELAYAGLHQLCAPLFEHAERLPGPQQEALRTVFGLSAGPPPDRFLVGLAVLSLLSEVAGRQPLICVIDDEQWLDQASALALAFAARRLAADPVGLLFAAREPGEELTGLAELAVKGLHERDARILLNSVLTGPLDVRVRDLIVAETRGNPLALLELPRGLTQAELAGGFGLPRAVSLTGQIEESFRRQLEALPAMTRRLLVLAAADPLGDPALIWRAAGRLGLSHQTAEPAQKAGLAEFGARIRFRHPLARSVAYQSASLQGRQEAHRVLAEETDPVADPDRRAWHRAQAAEGPDEEVAAELERSADRAQARGGLAAAAAFLNRSVRLTANPERLAERTLAAARASMQAGAFDQALGLLVMAEAGSLDELDGARLDLLRGKAAFASGLGNDAPALLFKAARRLEPLNLNLARETYLEAWGAVVFAGRSVGGDPVGISRAARALPRSSHPGPMELLLDGLASLITDGLSVAAPMLRQATSAFASADIAEKEVLRWGWLAHMAACFLWDDDVDRAILARHLQLTRNAGALEQLPISLEAAGIVAAYSGDFEAAASLIAETEAVCEATGSHIARFADLLLNCLRGSQAEAFSLIDAMISATEGVGHGIAASFTHWAASILYNGLGRYDEAREAARRAADDPSGVYVCMWALPELIEASVRTGNALTASDALTRLVEMTQVSGTDLTLGMEARCHALVSEGEAAENWYREAVDRLGRTQLRPELARVHLLYGEWLRREGRRVQAREQLRTAHAMLDEIGMEAFAGRARRELQSTGEIVRRKTAATASILTAQEAQIARLAAEGHSNPEIGAQLLLSARTVEWHLSKIYNQLGIGSRRELRTALAAVSQAAPKTA